MFDVLAAGITAIAGAAGVACYALNLFQEDIREWCYQRNLQNLPAEKSKWEGKLTHRVKCKRGAGVAGFIVFSGQEDQFGNRKVTVTDPPYGFSTNNTETWAIFKQWEFGANTETVAKTLAGSDKHG